MRTWAWSRWTAPRSSKKVRLYSPCPTNTELTKPDSSTIQQLSNPASKMSDPTHQDRPPPLYRREVSHERSHHSLLRHLKAVPE